MDKKIMCPMRDGLCIEDGAIVNGELSACRFWIHVAGKNPQNGETIDAKDCAIAWMPILLIENSKEQRTTGKELEALRKEVAEQQGRTTAILARGLAQSSKSSQRPGTLGRDETGGKLVS